MKETGRAISPREKILELLGAAEEVDLEETERREMSTPEKVWEIKIVPSH